jgi:hypothetical protein
MENRNEHDDDRKRSLKSEAENQARKPYRSPRLVVYGDLSRLTAMKGGNKDDGGGNPDTKS